MHMEIIAGATLHLMRHYNGARSISVMFSCLGAQLFLLHNTFGQNVIL